MTDPILCEWQSVTAKNLFPFAIFLKFDTAGKPPHECEKLFLDFFPVPFSRMFSSAVFNITLLMFRTNATFKAKFYHDFMGNMNFCCFFFMLFAVETLHH